MSLENTELHRRHTPEPELVPILDALTCIIFFLMYTTTFMELTSITLPPSAVSLVKNNEKNQTVPLTPKIYVQIQNNDAMVVVRWMGKTPGSEKKKIARVAPEKYSLALKEAAESLVAKFKKKFPTENSIQLGMSDKSTYQELISVMDGVAKEIPDIVLVSPEDVAEQGEVKDGSG